MDRKEAKKKLPSIPKDAIEDLGFGVRENTYGEISLNLPIPTFVMGKHGITKTHSIMIDQTPLLMIISSQTIDLLHSNLLELIPYSEVIEKTIPRTK